MKNITILGSTGSIGCNTLKIIEMFPDRFKIKALAAGKNIELLLNQIKLFKPEVAVVLNEELALKLKISLPLNNNVKILYGEDGYKFAASYDDVDIVVAAMVGAAGLIPALSAIEAKKRVALANKETLVMAGVLVMERAEKNNVDILPVDSEHSAIFQCLEGHKKKDVEKILLTASGGPFLNTEYNSFKAIKAKDALNHPVWKMGKKISIDSATLMNKGLEVIEAKYLFNIPENMIQVIIHPQSIIHSMVAFKDGSVMAQMGVPDMKGAISYAMSYPERLPLNQPIPDFVKIGSLTFFDPDFEKFSCLSLAFQALKAGKTLPAVLNASNEVAVNAFLNNDISFDSIPKIIKKTMDSHKIVDNPSLCDILNADLWARKQAESFCNSFLFNI